MKTVQLIIDPQKDFIFSPTFNGALGVNGAYEDMLKLSDYLQRVETDAIVVTLDTHNRYDIAHKAWWKDENGKHPNDYTIISVEDVQSGKWRPVDEKEQDYALFYVKELQKNNKYKLMVWPDHCIDGTEGHKVNEELKSVLDNWETKNNKKVQYVNKGTNPKTEHYSGLKAEVVLEGAKETELNKELIEYLNSFDVIEVSGEAISHCVGSTLIDLLQNLPLESRQKVVILEDCTSPVTGFENQATEFLEQAIKLGANIKKTQIPKLKIN